MEPSQQRKLLYPPGMSTDRSRPLTVAWTTSGPIARARIAPQFSEQLLLWHSALCLRNDRICLALLLHLEKRVKVFGCARTLQPGLCQSGVVINRRKITHRRLIIEENGTYLPSPLQTDVKLVLGVWIKLRPEVGQTQIVSTEPSVDYLLGLLERRNRFMQISLP